MPVGAVGGGGAGDGGVGEGEVRGAGGVPEGDCVGGEVLWVLGIAVVKGEKGEKGEKGGGGYNLIGNVVPDVSFPGNVPLGSSSNLPSQRGVAGAGSAADPTRLQLSEVALEEADLVLAVQARGVGGAALDAEMVVDLAAVDGRGGLRDQLGAAHGLAIPVGGAG